MTEPVLSEGMALLKGLGLTDEAKLERLKGIGASDANIIMGGDAKKIEHLWEIKTGLCEGDDLTDVLPVMMGLYTEPFNAAWYEKLTGIPVVDRNTVITSDKHPFMRATLDGRVHHPEYGVVPWQAKHINAFSKMEDVIARYTPQVTHEMYLENAKGAILSCLIGNLGYEAVYIELDWVYAAVLIDRETEFWSAVTKGERPVALMKDAPPPPSYSDMVVIEAATANFSNEWTSHAFDWLTNRNAAKTFEKASEALKKLVPGNAKRVYGSGIEVTRAKNNALTVREVDD